MLLEQNARRDAEGANRAKDEFLAMLGHELRNPLGAISSAVEVLQRTEPGAALSGRALQIIARQTANLAHMVDDLLDVARVISGKVSLTRQAFDLAELTGRVVTTLLLNTQDQKHEIALHAQPVWVHADPIRIEQVIANLVGNAMRYTPAGQPIEVAVASDGGNAVLTVRDHGEGIPAPLLDRVFDLFVQGERSLDRRGGGLGVGLTLVQRLVRLHDGSVTASSSDEGSVFVVKLPTLAGGAATATVTEKPPREAIHSPTPPRRVVLIEDNADAAHVLRMALELDGHQVHVEADGLAGLNAIMAMLPEVAIVDLGLPQLSGFEVAQRCRAQGYPGLLISTSGYGQPSDARDAARAGFDEHLVKPIALDRLRDLLAGISPSAGPILSAPPPPDTSC